MADTETRPHYVNLFLAGAAKAGTSSLWKALGRNPEIFVPSDELNKEPSFFSPIASARGQAWYQHLFAEGKDRKYCLDSSVAYLATPDSAAKIHAYNKDAKIILVLRNPTARAYSLYCWMVAEGYEWAPSFEAALDLEDRRAEHPENQKSMPQYFWNYMYRRSGLYSGQIERFQNLFGSNVLLVNFHELVERPDHGLRRILNFLELDSTELSLKQDNPSLQVISPRLSFTVRRLQRGLERRFPGPFSKSKKSRDFLLWACTTHRRPPPMRTETRAELDVYFANDVELLRSRHGIDLRASDCTQNRQPAHYDLDQEVI